jgi:hypothetical protein
MSKKRFEKDFEILKQDLLTLQVPIPGTIHELYARCGSETCPCATDKSKRHGPYHRWHYRNQGQQRTVGVDGEMKSIIEEGIKNRGILESIVEKMLAIGSTYVESLLANKNIENKSKNP